MSDVYFWMVSVAVYGSLTLLLLYLAFRSAAKTPSPWTYRMGSAYSSLLFTDRASVIQYLAKGGITGAVIVQLTDGPAYDRWLSAADRWIESDMETVKK